MLATHVLSFDNNGAPLKRVHAFENKEGFRKSSKGVVNVKYRAS